MPPKPVGLRRALVLLLLVLAVVGGMRMLTEATRTRLGPQVAAETQPGDIHMIGSVTCVYCAQARAWFIANKIAFSECEIERDPQCAAAYNALNAPGTPVLLVRGRRLVGFDAQAIADAFEQTRREVGGMDAATRTQ